jgi:hypothetical protein
MSIAFPIKTINLSTYLFHFHCVQYQTRNIATTEQHLGRHHTHDGYHRVTIEIGQPRHPPPGDNGTSTSTLQFNVTLLSSLNSVLLSVVLLLHPYHTQPSLCPAKPQS